jgi:hypothetical protein
MICGHSSSCAVLTWAASYVLKSVQSLGSANPAFTPLMASTTIFENIRPSAVVWQELTVRIKWQSEANATTILTDSPPLMRLSQFLNSTPFAAYRCSNVNE